MCDGEALRYYVVFRTLAHSKKVHDQQWAGVGVNIASGGAIEGSGNAPTSSTPSMEKRLYYWQLYSIARPILCSYQTLQIMIDAIKQQRSRW